MKYYIAINCLLLLLSCGPITNNRLDNNSGNNPHRASPYNHVGPRSGGNTGSDGSGVSKIKTPLWAPPTPITPQEIGAKAYLDGNLPLLSVAPQIQAYWAAKNNALLTRLLAINNLKKQPFCYYAYAEERLGKGPSIYLKLEALEKKTYPLVFNDVAQWNSFKNDLIVALQAAGFGSAHTGENDRIVILGTSTTFFSENPGNGSNVYFNESPPSCVTSAQNALLKTSGAYSFDAKGSNTSDVDIHLFIPSLSRACEAVRIASGHPHGNTNTRDIYHQNTLGACFADLSAPAAAKAMVDNAKPNWQGYGAGGNRDPFTAASSMSTFINTWMVTLGGRELNFSVHVLPRQWVYNTSHAIVGDNHFDNDIYVTHGNFIINIP